VINAAATALPERSGDLDPRLLLAVRRQDEVRAALVPTTATFYPRSQIQEQIEDAAARTPPRPISQGLLRSWVQFGFGDPLVRATEDLLVLDQAAALLADTVECEMVPAEDCLRATLMDAMWIPVQDEAPPVKGGCQS
jgi:hypothetical protein